MSDQLTLVAILSFCSVLIGSFWMILRLKSSMLIALECFKEEINTYAHKDKCCDDLILVGCGHCDEGGKECE